ncbi:MAG: serine hydrolase, partial [Pseudomonadota bacterium]
MAPRKLPEKFRANIRAPRRQARPLGTLLTLALCTTASLAVAQGSTSQGVPSTALTTAPYALPGGAAAYEDPYIAAGFRALFTCSAHFLMGRPLEDLAAVELKDTGRLELPAPVIDNQRGLVSAEDGRGNRVTVAYRESLGCTVIPPHWQQGDIARLPALTLARFANDPDVAYPLGDFIETPAPNDRQQALLDAAFDGLSYGENTLTAGVLIIRNGEVVAERYRDGFGPHQGYRTWSTAKSISATLIGLAEGEGLLDITAPVGLSAWAGPADPRAVITWEQLLHMSSGLWSKGANTNAIYFAGQDAESAATRTHLEAAPGTRWKYANNDTLLLLLGLKEALGDDLAYLRYPYDKLLHRIGMYHTWMETDHLGNFIGSSQVYTTLRDLGRFALLYLNDGVWNNERVLPEGWTSYVTEPAPALERKAG